MKSLVVDTIPKDARNRGSINLGLEIVAREWDADVCHWSDNVDVSQYDRIGFNVFYITHVFNLGAFIARHGLRKGGRVRLVAGGQGLTPNGLLSGIVDEEFAGELDGAENAEAVVSEPVIRGGKAVLEIARGCKMRCKFCEYTAIKSMREKPLALVESQMDAVIKNGVRQINFMSANFPAYTHIDGMMEAAIARNVRVTNADFAVNFVHRVVPWLDYLPKYLKLGIESWDPETRKRIAKNFSDDYLKNLIDQLLQKVSGLHFYLIYGLPGDDYDKWFQWLEYLAKKRREFTVVRPDLFGDSAAHNSKPIRFEFNITNFEPVAGTPLEGAPDVNFREKEKFLRQWSAHLMKHGFHLGTEIDYKNSGGRFGRKEKSYQLLMALRRGGPELTEAILTCFPRGISRSISDVEAGRFLDRKTSACNQ